MPAISVQSRLKQKDHKFKVSLSYRGKSTLELRLSLRGGERQKGKGEEGERRRGERESLSTIITMIIREVTMC